jgi:hypothetical protein
VGRLRFAGLIDGQREAVVPLLARELDRSPSCPLVLSLFIPVATLGILDGFLDKERFPFRELWLAAVGFHGISEYE